MDTKRFDLVIENVRRIRENLQDILDDANGEVHFRPGIGASTYREAGGGYVFWAGEPF